MAKGKSPKALPCCPNCGKSLRVPLRKHLSHCSARGRSPLPLKRPLPPVSPLSRCKAVCQDVSAAAVEAALAGDHHSVTLSDAPTDQLFPPPATAAIARSASPDFSTSDDAPFTIPTSSPTCVPAPTATDLSDAEFMRRYLPFIDPSADDFYRPDNFDETKMQYVEPLPQFRDSLPSHLLSQIDLFCTLQRAGCSLYMYDELMSWLRHYLGRSDGTWSENVG